MRLLVTSRPSEDDIEKCFHQFRQDLGVSENDLSIFIDKGLNEISYMTKVVESMRSEIQEQLRSQAGGTFLWVSIVLGELSHQRMPTRKDINTILKSIPTDLKVMYERIFNLLVGRIPILRKILVWVVNATR